MANTVKKWMIISWAHIPHLDDAYGSLLDTVEGTHEEALKEAREWVPMHKPVGLVEIVEP